MKRFRPGWYLIYTRPLHEKKVHHRLTELNIRSFLPMKKALRVWHDRRKYVNEPLFPSYVFIYLDDMHNYYDSMQFEGVLNYVKVGKEIARVGESIVESIRLATSEAADIDVSAQKFLPGQKVVISEGALTGLACEIVEFNNHRKLLVRVELLQRSLLLSLPGDHLLAT